MNAEQKNRIENALHGINKAIEAISVQYQLDDDTNKFAITPPAWVLAVLCSLNEARSNAKNAI